MSTETSIFAAAVVLFAYTVRGIAGFGSGLIAIPLLALAFPLQAIVPIVVLLDYLGSASQGLRNREHISWPDLAPLLPFTVVGVVSALYLLDALDADFLRRALGIFVLAYAIYQLLPLPPLRASRLSAVPYGFLGGLVGTLFGTGGPFYVIYFGLRALDKNALRASFALWFIVDGTMRLAGYYGFGFFPPDVVYMALMAIPFAAIGLLAGGRIHVGLSQLAFKRIISVLLVASGTGLLLKS